MLEPRECGGCDRHTVPGRDLTSEASQMTKSGPVGRVNDVCPECGHVMVENRSGPGARAWAESRSVELAPDVA